MFFCFLVLYFEAHCAKDTLKNSALKPGAPAAAARFLLGSARGRGVALRLTLFYFRVLGMEISCGACLLPLARIL